MVEFENLYCFFDYFDRCPFCRKRLSPNICYISGKSVLINIDNSDIVIDISTNSAILKGGAPNESIYNASIFNLCNNYHFYYACNLKIDLTTNSISDISLSKTHFLLRFDDTHFVVNTNFASDTTSIRITNSNYNTKEITTAATEFDFSNRKAITKRLSNISLLI